MLPRSVSDHPVSLDTVITSPFPSYTMSHDLARLQRRCVLGLIYPSFLLMPQWLLLLNHLLTPHIYFPSISFHHSVISITTQRAISGYCVWQYAGRHGQSLWCMAGTLVHNCGWGGGLSRCHKLTFLSYISHTVAVLIMNIRIHTNISCSLLIILCIQWMFNTMICRWFGSLWLQTVGGARVVGREVRR